MLFIGGKQARKWGALFSVKPGGFSGMFAGSLRRVRVKGAGTRSGRDPTGISRLRRSSFMAGAKQRVADAVAYAKKIIAEARPHTPAPVRRRSYDKEIA
jgi:hypothetical protein